MARWRSTKASHSTGYSSAIVCSNNALIGGDNCGVGKEEGGLIFSNQGAIEIKGEEEAEGRREGGREARVPSGDGNGGAEGHGTPVCLDFLN